MLNDRQIKHLMDAILVYTTDRHRSYASACDDTDALFDERAKRDQSTPVGASSTAMASSRGGPVADGITDQEMVRICMASANLLMQAGRQQELLYSVIDGSIREAIAIDRGYRIIRRDGADALFDERAKRDEMRPTGSPITLTDDECEAIIDTVAGAWELLSHMRGPIRSTIAETLAVVNRDRRDAMQSTPVGASSTAVDETQGDAVRRFTADEVAEKLVRVEPDAVGQRAIVYIGSIVLSVEDDMAAAECRAVACRRNIRRTLEASE